ncbi:hypothetical protein BLA29_006980 [Euroglyphus maynei]|uniref:Uncharacterized protein n=1 Tax=Euroglyphus maynei TaxID=6958 RepID=A0A1Y3B8A8_EURMA|nr:hypothetical protein BLA29_006980 [Euroglyphus maynei]
MFQQSDGSGELQIRGIQYQTEQINIQQNICDYIDNRKRTGNDLKYIISTRLGSGPKIVTEQFDSNSLLSANVFL